MTLSNFLVKRINLSYNNKKIIAIIISIEERRKNFVATKPHGYSRPHLSEYEKISWD